MNILVAGISLFFFVALAYIISSAFYKNSPFLPLRLLRLGIGIIAIFALLKLVSRIKKAVISQWAKQLSNLLAGIVVLFIILESAFTFLPFYTHNHYSPLSKNWLQKYWHVNSDGVRDSEMIENINPDLPFILFIGDEFAQGIGINDVNKRFVNIIREQLSSCYNIVFYGRNKGNTRMAVNMIRNLPFHPNNIIYVHSADDIIGNSVTTNKLVEISSNSIFLEENSYLIDYLNEYKNPTFKERYQELIDYNKNEEFIAIERDAFANMANFCQNSSYRLGVVLMPVIKNKDYIIASNETMVEPLATYIKHKATPQLNLTETLLEIPNSKRKISRYSEHASAYTHEQVASVILEFMLEKSMIVPSCIQAIQ